MSTNRRGRVRSQEDIITEADQILVMNNERFTVPEIIFRPDDIGRPLFQVWLESKCVDFRFGSGRPFRNNCLVNISPPSRPARLILGQHWLDRRKYQVSWLSIKIVCITATLEYAMLIIFTLEGCLSCDPWLLPIAKSSSTNAMSTFLDDVLPSPLA